MNTDLIIVAGVVGLGTWLFRFLPTRLRRSSANVRLTGAMEGIGPAAIATLCIASVLPELAPGAPDRSIVLLGCAATGLAFAAKRNVVLATLAGALAYGIAFAFLG